VSVAVLIVTTPSAMRFIVLKMRSLSAQASRTSHSSSEGVLEYHSMETQGVVVVESVVLPALSMAIDVGSGVSVGFWVVLSR